MRLQKTQQQFKCANLLQLKKLIGVREAGKNDPLFFVGAVCVLFQVGPRLLVNDPVDDHAGNSQVVVEELLVKEYLKAVIQVVVVHDEVSQILDECVGRPRRFFVARRRFRSAEHDLERDPVYDVRVLGRTRVRLDRHEKLLHLFPADFGKVRFLNRLGVDA